MPFIQTQPDGSLNITAGIWYIPVAASTTKTCVGYSGSGAKGDWLDGVLVVPSSLSPGTVQVSDGSQTTTLFVGGTTSLSNMVSFYLPFGARSTSTAWSVITGVNLSAVAIGDFS